MASGDAITSTGHAAYQSLPGYTSFEEKLRYDPERGTRFCTIVKAEPIGDGEVKALPDGSLDVSGCTGLNLYVTNATSFNGFDKDPAKEGKPYRQLAEARIRNASAKGAEAVRRDQLADYTALFDRVTLDLGTTPDSIASLPTDVQLMRYTDLGETNPDLEELYFNYGRYLLISCSAHRRGAGQSAGPVERVSSAAVEQQLYHQHQCGGELLAGRGDRSGRASRQGFDALDSQSIQGRA